MDTAILVQNIKKLCALRGVKPTVACRDSGAGKDFINKIETQGSTPSVEKVQLLAQYLGVTTSELLGEGQPAPWDELSEEKREAVETIYRQLISLSLEDLQALGRVVEAIQRPAPPASSRER